MKKLLFGFMLVISLLFAAVACNSAPADTFEKIVISSYPETTTYDVGEILDLSGLTVEGLYQDGTYKTVEDYTTDVKDGTVLDEEGTHLITVSCSGKTAQFAVTVQKDELQPSPVNEDYTILSSNHWWLLKPADIKIKSSDIRSVSFLKTKPEGTRVFEWNIDYMQEGYVKCYVYGSSGNYRVCFVGEKILGNWDSTHLFGAVGSEEFSEITAIDFGHFDASCVADMRNMFSGCSALKTITLDKFDTSSVTAMTYMFAGCSSLSAIDLSSFDTSGVTRMRGMFEGCSGLTSLNLDNFDTSEVTEMDYMFNGCSSLTSLNLSSFDTSKVITLRKMFEKCSALKSLDLSKFKTSNVSDMSGMFLDCSALGSLNVIGFNTLKVTTMAGMFSGCSSLTSLNLNSFETDNVKDMRYMFNGCTNLVTIAMDHWTTHKLVSMDRMFADCSGLKILKLYIDFDSVEDMSELFRGCSGLDELHLDIIIPDKEILCDMMFTGCGHSGTEVYIIPGFDRFWSKTELGTDTATWERYLTNVYRHK